MKKIVYIAGPYRGPSEREVELNIRQASDLAYNVWCVGLIAICPHLNSYRFGSTKLGDEVFLNGDLEILKRCDAVMLTENWEKSEGAIAEVQCATAHQIPVFESITKLIQWNQTGVV